MVTGPPWDASSPKKWGESQRAADDGGVKVFVTWSAQGTLRSLGGGGIASSHSQGLSLAPPLGIFAFHATIISEEGINPQSHFCV